MDDAKRRLTRQFIIFQFIAFASFAPMNYYNVFLKEIGFSSQQIGLWGSVSGVVAMISLPIWGIISDKIRSPKKTYMISMVVYALIFTALPMAGRALGTSALPLYGLIVLYALVKQPTHSLQDAWFVSTLRTHGVNYTATRLWGSAGFAVFCIIIGLAVDYTGIDAVFYLAPALVLPLMILCLRFKESRYETAESRALAQQEAEKAGRARQKLRPWVLFKNYYFMTAFIMTVVLAFYIAVTASFYAYILEHAGLPAEKYGLISGYGSFVQVAAMLFINRFCRRVSMPKLLVAAGCFSIAENIMYALASNLAMMFVAGTFWGIATAVNVTVVPTYIYSLVPREYSATAQTLNGTVVMILSIVGNLAGGYLIAGIGIAHYNLCVAAIQVVLVALFALSIPFGRKVLKIPAPESVTRAL